MNVKKCDRCKKYCDEYAGIHKHSEEGTVFQNHEIPYYQLIINNYIYSGTVPKKCFYLCPDWMMELDKWITKKGD